MKEKDLLKTVKKILLEDSIREAIKEDALIKINNQNGKATIETKGTNASIIVLLASLEQSILRYIGISEETFSTIKEMICAKSVKKEKF